MTFLDVANRGSLLRSGCLLPLLMLLACGGRVRSEDGSGVTGAGGSAGSTASGAAGAGTSGSGAEAGVPFGAEACDAVPRVVATSPDPGAAIDSISVSSTHLAFSIRQTASPKLQAQKIYAGKFGGAGPRPIPVDLPARDGARDVPFTVLGSSLYLAVPILLDVPNATTLALLDLDDESAQASVRGGLSQNVPYLLSAVTDWNRPEVGQWLYGIVSSAPRYGAFAIPNPGTVTLGPGASPLATEEELVSPIANHVALWAVGASGRAAYGYFYSGGFARLLEVQDPCERYVAVSSARIGGGHAVYTLIASTCMARPSGRVERTECAYNGESQPTGCAADRTLWIPDTPQRFVRDFRVLPGDKVVAIIRDTVGSRSTEHLVDSRGGQESAFGGDGVTGSVERISALTTFGPCVYWAEVGHDGYESRILRTLR